MVIYRAAMDLQIAPFALLLFTTRLIRTLFFSLLYFSAENGWEAVLDMKWEHKVTKLVGESAKDSDLVLDIVVSSYLL